MSDTQTTTNVVSVPSYISWILSAVGVVWMIIIYGVVKKIYNEWSEIRDEETEELQITRLKEYKPEPLVNEFPRHMIDRHLLDDDCVNLIRLDFLSLSHHEVVLQRSVDTIKHYGVGSCSPPAFFGNSELHLVACKRLTDAYKAENAILYSWGTLTVGSVVASYLDHNSIVFINNDTNADIRCFLETIKCQVLLYSHGIELEELLDDTSSKNKFFILEGIYATTGRICDLPVLVDLAERFKARIILDETFSFGILGDRGNGVLEHYGMDVGDVDVICGSLEPVWGVVGGFSVGRSNAIDIQTLQSKAYIYTAALPPFLVQAFLTAFELKSNRHKKLESLALEFDVFLMSYPELENLSSPKSPRKILGISNMERRKDVFNLCRDKYKVYLDINDNGLVINLCFDLDFQEKHMKRLEDALIHSARLIRDTEFRC